MTFCNRKIQMFRNFTPSTAHDSFISLSRAPGCLPLTKIKRARSFSWTSLRCFAAARSSCSDVIFCATAQGVYYELKIETKITLENSTTSLWLVLNHTALESRIFFYVCKIFFIPTSVYWIGLTQYIEYIIYSTRRHVDGHKFYEHYGQNLRFIEH